MKLRNQRGFTLIEAMTAGVVLSILTLGLTGVWTSAGASVDRHVIREKAIWTLNGQMERLVALYQFTNFATFGESNSTGYGYPAPYSDTRKIYNLSTDNAMAPPGTPEALQPVLGPPNGFVVELPLNFPSVEGYPVALTGVSGPIARNYVWIDRGRNLVGRLSWQASDLLINACGSGNQPTGTSPCLCLNHSGSVSAAGVRCRELQLTLEFPLRWNATIGDAVALDTPTEILSLRTIVGRRL